MNVLIDTNIILDAVAKRAPFNKNAEIGIEYIITRDTKDFTNSPIPSISPENFIARFK